MPKTLGVRPSFGGTIGRNGITCVCSVDIWPLDGPAALWGAISTRLSWFAPRGQTTGEQRNEKKHNVEH